MPKFNPPESMPFDSPSEWPEWRERFSRFRIATKLHKDDGDVQVSSLIYAMGRQAENIYKTFRFPARPAATEQVPNPIDPRDDYDTVLKKFDEYFVPKRNTIHERAKFYQRVQQSGESIEAFVRNLHELATHCGFEDKECEHIRDRLICGMLDKEMSQKLQLEQDDDLTLEKAVEKSRHSELVKSQNEADVALVKDNAKKKRHHKDKQKEEQVGNKKKCGQCGYIHRKQGPEYCPAKGKTCNKCNKIGHFAQMCHTKGMKEMHEISIEDEDKFQYFCGTVENHNENHVLTEDYMVDTDKLETCHCDAINCEDRGPAWKVTLHFGNSDVTFKLDSGADVSVMGHKRYMRLSPRPALKPVTARLTSPGGPLTCSGQFLARAKVKDIVYHFRVIVVKNDIDSLLSRGAASRMGLISKIDTVKEGIGCLKTDPVKIVLKEDSQPSAITVARRVPIPILPKVKEELERMKTAGVIEEITRPTPWCAPMVPVMKKSGKVRICVDLKKLNLSVRRERYILPTLEDLTSKLSGATVFSCLDAASGFYQIPLDKDSQELTTFITPFGRYCFRRLPFGITSAPEIFMRKMNEILVGAKGVFTYMDDILVYGKDKSEHDERLARVKEILKRAGLQLNKDKCQYGQTELKFLGHKFTKEGIVADEEKVSAIVNMPPPSSVTQLRQVLGMVHYLGSYLPDLHITTRPLNDLLKDNVVWSWGPDQEVAFKKMKELVSSTPVLAYYDVNRETIVSADASSYGIGGVLLQAYGQKLKPVAFCSRTLTSAEQRYAQIEKECLAGVWACEKFDRFLCGLEEFRLLTDHKPLVPLINAKDLDNVPLRCQRLLMRLMRYSAKAEYSPGKTLVISDALSRSPVNQPAISTTETDVGMHVDYVESNLPISPTRRDELQSHTREDAVLQSAVVYTLTGWPRYEKDVPESLKELFNVRNLLSVSNGLLTYTDRIVVPTKLRPDMLDKIHAGHQGITKCMERARVSVWWPGITHDIKRIVGACDHCEVNRPSQKKEPLMTTPLPTGPWQRVAVDLCTFKGNDFLIIVDYYSRWIEILHVRVTSAAACIAKLKDSFARFGIPMELISDNGPQFASSDFKLFAKKYGFTHTTTSPYLPNANGEAERAVQTAKGILRQEDPWLGLLVYRDTVIAATGHSPSQLMLGRHIRTTLPTLPSALKPNWPNPDLIRMKDNKAKQSYEYYYNRHHGVQSLPTLLPGDGVRMKTHQEKNWTKEGIVTSCAETPRSYTVQTESGRYRRNRRDLRSTEPNEDQDVPKLDIPKSPVVEPPSEVPSSPAPATPIVRRSSRAIKKPSRLIEES